MPSVGIARGLGEGEKDEDRREIPSPVPKVEEEEESSSSSAGKRGDLRGSAPAPTPIPTAALIKTVVDRDVTIALGTFSKNNDEYQGFRLNAEVQILRCGLDPDATERLAEEMNEKDISEPRNATLTPEMKNLDR